MRVVLFVATGLGRSDKAGAQVASEDGRAAHVGSTEEKVKQGPEHCQPDTGADAADEALEGAVR